LGLFLVYNTISALISQQVDQIGIMKAVGAKTSQILRFFLTMIFVYGLLALALAVPAGMLGAWGITSWLVGSFNADPGGFSFSPLAIAVQVAISLLTPLIVALIPIFAGSRITVREAINTYGLNAKPGLLDRLLTKMERLSRLFLLTISNTFRRKWRVILTQITLVLSGLIFIMVISLRDSVVYTFNDVLFSILNFNVNFLFDDSERIGRVEQLTLAYPGVTAAEMWGFAGGTIHLADAAESEDDESASVFGLPLPTDLYGAQLRGGRWLIPEDTYAVVLNQTLAEDAGVEIGDWVTFKLNNTKDVNFRVVGLVFDPIITNMALVPRDLLLREIGQVNKSQAVWIKTKQEGLVYEEALAKDMRAYYEANGLEVSAQRGLFGGMGESATAIGNAIVNQFNFIVVLLGIMAIIIGAVGSIALSGTLSLSVMERRREIGVMRAIGASSWSVALLFIGEGLILGWLSWLIALPFTIPAGQLILKALSAAFSIDLIYKYTPTGALLWLGIMTILSVLASWLPARSAIGISVRESLAYQ
jgi:putative ABC transport system permease protein